MSLFRAELVKLRGYWRLGVFSVVALTALSGFGHYKQFGNHQRAEQGEISRQQRDLRLEQARRAGLAPPDPFINDDRPGGPKDLHRRLRIALADQRGLPTTPISELVPSIAALVAGTAVTLTFVASLAVAVTTVRRSVAGGMAATVGVLAVDVILAQLIKPWTQWSISYNVGAVLIGTPHRVGTLMVRTWVRNFPIDTEIPLWRTSAQFLLIAAVLLAFAWRTLRRTELT